MESILKRWKIYASILVIVVLACYFTPNENIYYFLRFDSAVWGSVSDWIMISVTLFTAVYLVKTFKEQKRVNDLSAVQHKKQNLPMFKVDAKPEIYPDFPDVVFVNLTLTNNPCYKTSFKALHKDLYVPDGDELNFVPGDGRIYAVNKTNTDTITISFSDTPMMEVLFYDGDGNNYRQEVKRFNNYFSITWPEEIKKPDNSGLN